MRKFKLFYTILFAFLLIFQGVSCDAKKLQKSTDAKGYVGKLPDLTRKYEVQQNKNDNPFQSVPAKDFNSENELKPVPTDNPAFVNIILKPDKTSQYVNDINEFIPMLENIFDIIENNENVQVFNAKVYFFNKSVDYFRDKYMNKPESSFVSYRKLMELSMHARSIALLRSEAEKYNPYLAYGKEGYIYNSNSIDEQLGYLKSEIENTILLLRESN